MLIVTAGALYTDIDAFACAVALSEAIAWREEAIAWLPGRPNATIPIRYHNHPAFFSSPPGKTNGIVLVDISNPNFIPPPFLPGDVRVIFDHHQGFEEFWRGRHTRSIIEPIGAAATLVLEEINLLGQLERLSSQARILLAMAVVSNTANLQMKMTTMRDIAALNQLESICGLQTSWRETFLHEIENALLDSPLRALEADTKSVRFQDSEVLQVGQIEVSLASQITSKLSAALQDGANIPDIVIIPSRISNTTTILFRSVKLSAQLASILNYPSQRSKNLHMIELPYIMLRKELLPLLTERTTAFS